MYKAYITELKNVRPLAPLFAEHADTEQLSKRDSNTILVGNILYVGLAKILVYEVFG